MGTVTTREFLGMARSGERRWELPIRTQILGGRSGSLFGGAGLAAGVVALEDATDRPVVWAMCQFLSTVGPPATLDVRAELPAIGGSVTQGRVQAYLGDREIFTAIGSAGSRRELLKGSWYEQPSVPPPLESEPVVRRGEAASIHQHIEARMATGMFGFVGTGTPTNDGANHLWIRLPGVRHDAAGLAVMADYLASAVGNAFGRLAHCSSLDNTIRFAQPMTGADEDGWILCENRIDFVGNGFANGTCLMSNQAGELLATASQSMIVSLPPRLNLDKERS